MQSIFKVFKTNIDGGMQNEDEKNEIAKTAEMRLAIVMIMTPL